MADINIKVKPLIEIIDTTNEPNIIEQILTIGGSNAPIKQTPMASILLVIFTTATLTWAATSQRNNAKK